MVAAKAKRISGGNGNDGMKIGNKMNSHYYNERNVQMPLEQKRSSVRWRGESSVNVGILPDTTEEDMQAYVQETHSMPSKCTKLQTKYNDYASFQSEGYVRQLSEVYDSEKWPVGAYRRRFYNGRAAYAYYFWHLVMVLKAFRLALVRFSLTVTYFACRKLCCILNSFHDNYYGYGASPVDASLWIISGRPHGGGFFNGKQLIVIY